jgi:hypothetical protein
VRNSSAQGNALGIREIKKSALKGRDSILRHNKIAPFQGSSKQPVDSQPVELGYGMVAPSVLPEMAKPQ